MFCVLTGDNAERPSLHRGVRGEKGLCYNSGFSLQSLAGVTPQEPTPVLDRPSSCHFLPGPAERRHWQAIVPGRA